MSKNLSEQVAALEQDVKFRADLVVQAKAEIEKLRHDLTCAETDRDWLSAEAEQIPRLIAPNQVREGQAYIVVWTGKDGNTHADKVSAHMSRDYLDGLVAGVGGLIGAGEIEGVILLSEPAEGERQPLPTEPGSLIEVTEFTGANGVDTEPSLAVLGPDGFWHQLSNPEVDWTPGFHITGWRPMKLVPS